MITIVFDKICMFNQINIVNSHPPLELFSPLEIA